MALYDLHRSASTPVSAILAHRFASAILALITRFQAKRPQSLSLQRLTDRQLDDIGLNRADLGR